MRIEAICGKALMKYEGYYLILRKTCGKDDGRRANGRIVGINRVQIFSFMSVWVAKHILWGAT